eukprot:CAMPEP_0194308554 /NCGR_PEP_ID=MMETSP0171-20130528/5514_1 /TAXON_ID=218684 /ORGANISM="Corethron pennatum, Strain L29A3" /LENGTH=263 /DNA_ID=CAMNT_0039061247 /DNA_START=129 /DNA_END=916 /DNA_ORIENTATION=-
MSRPIPRPGSPDEFADWDFADCRSDDDRDHEDEEDDSDDSDDMEEDEGEEEEEEEEEEPVKTHADHKADGNACYKAKDYRAAIAHYTLAVHTAEAELLAAPSPPLALLAAQYYGNRSAAHSMLLKHRDVIADCAAALRHDPSMAKAHFRAARAQVLLGRCGPADASFTAGLVLDPGNAAALKERGAARSSLRRLELARRCLAKSESDGTPADARQSLAQADAALAVSPNWQEARLVRAGALAALGRSEEGYSATTSLLRAGAG